ncbi:YjhX family toxin [Dinoroseobacter sp. S124A]|uniref:YjhX family toxin n=1 Tax=Dinoroseobacter sp. S124A TaxID=3415128 RepID=UPI003C7A717C
MTNCEVHEVSCSTRDGHVLTNFTLRLFDRLKKRRFIKSENGRPYPATRLGIRSVNPQYDNR